MQQERKIRAIRDIIKEVLSWPGDMADDELLIPMTHEAVLSWVLGDATSDSTEKLNYLYAEMVKKYSQEKAQNPELACPAEPPSD